jgi:tetratricopeptide (TPR) repeat protein
MFNTPLVGRDREKLELLAALDEVLGGRGRLLILEGEPGIGKTRLADEVGSIATDRGCTVCWGRCLEDGGAPAFWPWTQVLRACAQSDSSPDGIEDSTGYLARLLPEIFSSAGSKAAEPHTGVLSATSATGADEPEIERFGFFDAVATFLKSAAASRPMVIILDDLHAADEESILLLGFLVRDIRQTRMMIVATYRDSDIQRRPRVAQLLGSLSREGEALILRGLSLSDVAQFVELQAGIRPDEKMAEQLYNATEGNPFFLTEVVRLLTAQGQFSGESGRRDGIKIPNSVRATILRRVAQLSRTAQEVVQVASIVGREFDWALLRSICDMEDAQLLSALDELVSLRVVTEATAPLRYRFSHALIMESVQDSVARTHRQDIHLRIAHELERLCEGESTLAQIAHHYLQALPIGDAGKAGEFTMRAADWAMRSLAYEEAVRLYRTALDTLDFQRSGQEQRRVDLLLKLGEAECRAHYYDRFRQTFLSAAEISRVRDDAQTFGRSVLGYGMLGSDPGRTDQQLVALIHEALARIGETQPTLKATLLARLAEEIRWTAPAPDTRQIIDESVSIARRYADPQTLVDALYIKFLTIRNPATAEERLALSTEMVSLGERHKLFDSAFNLRYHRGSVLLELGDIAEVDREILELNRLDEALRRQHLGFTEVISSMRSLMEGQVEDAERLAAQALEIGRRRPNTIADQIFVVQSVLIKRESGLLGEVVPRLERVVSQHPENLPMRSLLGFCYAETDKRSLAKAEFENLAADNFSRLTLDFRWFISMAFLCETCSYLADQSRALTLYDLLTPYSLRSASIGLFGYAGDVSYYLAILAAVLERFEDAEAHFNAAIEFETRTIARGWAARVRYRYAALLFSLHDDRQYGKALEMIRDALSVAEALGLRDLVTKSRELNSSLESMVTGTSAGIQSASEEGSTTFRREGDYWTIGVGQGVFRLRHSKGLGYIAHLLRQPGAEFHSLSLTAGVTADADDSDESVAAVSDMGNERLAEINLRRGLPDHAGQMLDVQAKAEYRQRLVQLKEELDDAREAGNVERGAQIEDEIDALHQELSRAVGLGGRDRRAGSTSERARLAVTRAIKAAIEKIAEHDAQLGLYLSTSIKTGTFCSYVPDARHMISWAL